MKQKKDREKSLIHDRETVGKIATDLSLKIPDTRDPIEIQREVHKDYDEHMQECISNGKKQFFGDFYVVVTTKMEKLLKNVLRNYFISRRSCPTPTFDQAVYKYTSHDDHIELLWVVPSQDACQYFKINAIYIPSEERELLRYVLEFFDGTLDKKAKELNNEQ